MDKKIYLLEWKGAESGPYSVAENRDMLSRGRIGLLHKIGTKDSAFVTLKDVDLDALEQSDARTANAPSDMLALASYAVAGIAFLSPWTLAASAAIAAYLWAAGVRRPAVLSIALSAAFARPLAKYARRMRRNEDDNSTALGRSLIKGRERADKLRQIYSDIECSDE